MSLFFFQKTLPPRQAPFCVYPACCQFFEREVVTMVFSVYVAGGFSFLKRVSSITKQIHALHYCTVVSHWIERVNCDNTPAALRNDATEDLKELQCADILVIVMEDPTYAYRGSFTELGFALGKKLPVILICPGSHAPVTSTEVTYSHYCMTNVFYHAKGIKHVNSVEEAMKALAFFCLETTEQNPWAAD